MSLFEKIQAKRELKKLKEGKTLKEENEFLQRKVAMQEEKIQILEERKLFIPIKPTEPEMVIEKVNYKPFTKEELKRIMETESVGIMETATSCLICGEDVLVYGYEAEHGCYKVCDKCKQAVLKTRTQLEKKKQKEKESVQNNICAMH